MARTFRELENPVHIGSPDNVDFTGFLLMAGAIPVVALGFQIKARRLFLRPADLDGAIAKESR
ncbi:MAG: hypothetical protein ACXWTP_11455 [Methylosarcina sp.]